MGGLRRVTMWVAIMAVTGAVVVTPAAGASAPSGGAPPPAGPITVPATGTGSTGSSVVLPTTDTTAVGPTLPVLPLGGPASEAAIWIAKQVGGGIIGAIAGKGFNEVLAELGLDRTSAKLDELKAELDEIKGQLTQLQQTMDLALKEIEKTQFAVLAQRVYNLRDRVLGAQGDFLEAMSYAGQADKLDTIKTLLDKVKNKVNEGGGIADLTAVVPEAIGPASSLVPKTFYQTLSNVLTEANTKKFFTWRDSVALDDVFNYLLYLQALQFDLIAQVKTAEGSSTDQIFDRVVQPYLGDKATFQAFVDGKTATPTAGALHEELGNELSLLPAGVVLDMTTGKEWSVDVPGGAQFFAITAKGPGVPVCYQGPLPSCVTDPHYSVGGTWPTATPTRAPGSPEVQLANKLESLGDGPAAEWHLPSMADLRTLLNGWKPEDGSRKNWLQAKSGSDPATCKPVTAGSGEAVTMANACVWPDDPNLWSDQFRGTLEDIRQNDEGYWAKVRTYIYGWGYTFLNVNDDTQPECFNFTGLLDWNDLGGQDYEFDPRGHTRAWPASGACGGSMVLERTLPAAEARKYYFAL